MAPADDRTGPHGAMTRRAQAAAGRAGDPGIPAPPRDEQAFRVFFQARRERMIGLVRVQVAGVVLDPEGIAQEGWCAFYPHWEDCAYPDAYLRQCMASAVSDALRKAAAEPRTYGLDATSGRLAAGPQARDDDPGDQPWDPELTRALRQLSPKLREFVILEAELNLGERSVAEIARILGIGRTAAYGRRRRAHKELRRLLPADYPELRAMSKRGRGRVEGWLKP
jgi:DNA-directed RNA polymerase specialized sigma24 family protein